MSLGAPELATKEYWDARYAGDDKDGYDWFKCYSEIRQFLERNLDECGGFKARILILGCGTSSLSADLYDAGYKDITSIDFSQNAIDESARLFADGRPGAIWEVMDIRSLDRLADDSFDCAIDKGTMDALLCHAGSPWDPPKDVVDNCAAEINEAARVLRAGGRFLMVSFRPSHFLRPRVQSETWLASPKVEQIGDFYYTVEAVRR
ncbi:Methyltransferase-like protein 13 [Savitreella phatthalungensis]